jgi:ribosomal protein S12 methylthiotransferase
VAGTYWLETLGCAKNQVDSEKLAGLLESEGYRRAARPARADLVVVNTCAFIEPAREESVEAVLALAALKKDGSRLVVTGCMAERYGDQLARALPEVDRVAGFGVPVTFSPARPSAPPRRGRKAPLPAAVFPSFDLLNLPRPPVGAPWAYVKVAEGCDRRCGFCAIPRFRGRQRSRTAEAVLKEVEALGPEVKEVVLVAQDPASWGRDLPPGEAKGGIAWLFSKVREKVDRVRLLYIYPSGLTSELIDAIGESGCPYFDLSLQHVSRPLLRRMRRPGDACKFLRKIDEIRSKYPDAAFRSSFIIGYPGEAEEDHDELLSFLAAAELDWGAFFAFSREDGTYAAGLPDQVPAELVAERARECSELQDEITAMKRDKLVGTTCTALVSSPGEARSHREAPEIDGVISVPRGLTPGTWAELEITAALGPDLLARPLGASEVP